MTNEIGWQCYEVIGSEVYLESKPDEPLKNYDDLQPGVKILVPSLFGDYFLMEVKKDSFGELYGGDETHACNLEFAKDDRKCWVTTGLINLKGIRKLKLETD